MDEVQRWQDRSVATFAGTAVAAAGMFTCMAMRADEGVVFFAVTAAGFSVWSLYHWWRWGKAKRQLGK